MSITNLFFSALAAQMLLDFFPVPWKGRVGLLKGKPFVGGGVVTGIIILSNLPWLKVGLLLYCIGVGVLFAVGRWYFPEDEPETAKPRREGASDAALRVLLSLVAATVFLMTAFPDGSHVVFESVRRSSASGIFFRPVMPFYGIVPFVSVWATGLLFSLGAGSLLVSSLLRTMPHGLDRTPVTKEAPGNPENVEEGIRNAGRLIGFFEAFIITTLVAINQPAAIGFIIAAKAIGRFKQMEERRFAEYFLVGTLANVSIAIIGGLVIRAFT